MATKYHMVHGCHDCPFLEAGSFGDVHCPYVDFLPGYFIDPLDIKKPPKGCPLLKNGTVTVMLSLLKEPMPF